MTDKPECKYLVPKPAHAFYGPCDICYMEDLMKNPKKAIRDRDKTIRRLRAENDEMQSAMEQFYATLKKYGYDNSNDLVDENIRLKAENEKLRNSLQQEVSANRLS